ncbi:hypothetical protein [Paraburkholderia sp. ZP32-5]|uniref:hypothetical protein n=1 Tax=Paraburkholderia sp. ZP32-5 TaxID=2883245 RepID=UPI001F2902D9|nr:hypothetical protein [Paraburkholderia sp. ZP32-5]
MRLRSIRWCVVVAGLCVASVSHAQDARSKADTTGQPASASKPVCVDAEVNGQRALSYDCLSTQLQPKPVATVAASQTAAEALATQPSNKVGTFNLSTEQNRFGSNWGKSVTPQRPAPPAPPPPSAPPK